MLEEYIYMATRKGWIVIFHKSFMNDIALWEQNIIDALRFSRSHLWVISEAKVEDAEAISHVEKDFWH